jgi:hypothetical protein
MREKIVKIFDVDGIYPLTQFMNIGIKTEPSIDGVLD